MPFRPAPNSPLTIRNRAFTVCEHPAAPGMAYGQSGRRALVYQLRDKDGRFFALKVFTQTFRTAEIEQSAKNLQDYATLLGLDVCKRWVLTDAQDASLLQQFPDLRYAVLMIWVQGSTWQEVILNRANFKPRQSYQFANGLVNILAGMERAGVAHCDLSGTNVLLPGLENGRPPVALVDVEEMYIPGAQSPAKCPAGSLGYNHPSAANGLWGADVDRFAGAVLIAEMLGWFDPQVRQSALVGADGSGEQYFDKDEMQKPCSRFDVLHRSLETHWSATVCTLFARAWNSPTLADCPSFVEWQDAFAALTARLPQLEELSQQKKDTGYNVRWGKLAGATTTEPLIVGRYRISELFSDGGFGTVYLAMDTRDNSPCVLKKNKDTSEESRRQFAREADLLRHLSHRNLVKVLNYLDLPNEGQYIVMELIQGDDLQTIMTRHGPTHLNWALPYIEQICDALSYLHTQNPPVIHRDIKPANIRITGEGRAVLIDFGIAKTIATNVTTTLGARAVSPGFSPPEQYGQNSTDARSDIYALGATVWSLLTGRPPQASVDRMAHDSMFPLSGTLPPHIEAAIQRAMSLNPAHRFASAREFWLALSGTVRPKLGVLSAGTQQPQAQPKPKPAGTKNMDWLIAIAAALFFLICSAAMLIFLLLPQPQPVPAPITLTSTPTISATPPDEFLTSTATPTVLTPTTGIPTATVTPTTTHSPRFAQISSQVEEVSLRKSPGYVTKPNSDVIVKIPRGQIVEILGGPKPADNLNWWKVSWRNYTGWLAEKTGSGYTILIFDPGPTPTPDTSGPAYDPDDPQGFIRWYFDAVCSIRDYEYTWQFLTPKFKEKNDAAGFDEYASFWDSEEKIDIQSITDLGNYKGTHHYEVLAVFHKKSGQVSKPLKLPYYLIFDENMGHWMFESRP